jgi:hypothetical protein
MLYEPYEVEISQEYLKRIISEVKETACLLGGWAVYLTVGENFRREHGRDYMGSRDIDLGFHIEKGWSKDELENSSLAIAVKTLSAMNFEPIGFRLVKHFHIDSKRELHGEEEQRTPSHEIFNLYVDPVVDHIPPEARDIFGFVPIDEPILEHSFIGLRYRTIAFYGKDVLLPLPHVLLATKLKSVRQRDKEYKRIKDIADIYALSWYSNEKLAAVKAALAAILPPQETRTIIESFTEEDLGKVSRALDIGAPQVQLVLSELMS